ncbi:MAG TPA: exodeoxyribonuclease VII small subunit [Dehalococcoidia bacterium]|nr:exodeoxyribonuclease VII small subunit [Dehalococcoidia bacterium]
MTRRESFETLYRRLEETVEKLEQGGLSLEDAIALYEEGMRLAKRCQELLDEAELRVTRLRQAFAERAAVYAAEEDTEEPLPGEPFDDEDVGG